MSLLIDWRRFSTLAAALIIFETIALFGIIRFVSYTEIDWKAYMEQVRLVLEHGERDYSKIRGGTGPLVYPAGHVWIYSVFYYLTDGGKNIIRAQAIFAGLYIASLTLVLHIYKKASHSVPPYVTILLCLSKRVHSIFVLRLFNDPIALLFVYASILLLTNRRWISAALFFSLGLSVKMNVLLFLPAFGIVLLRYAGFWKTLDCMAVIAAVQCMIAAPFLQRYPFEYVSRAFDFSRVFLYKWTANWRFVSEETFLSKKFALGLLVGHVLVLSLFAHFSWLKQHGGLFKFIISRLPFKTRQTKVEPVDAGYIVSSMFTCQIIGIVFSRSLHFQFYSWYYFTLPFLLWQCQMSKILKFTLWFLIEVCWNVYPVRPWSSYLLLLCHVAILYNLFFNPVEKLQPKTKKK